MSMPRLRPFWLWAVRDLLRFPGESAMMAAVLVLLTLVLSVPLLLTDGVSRTVTDIIESSAPSVVIQRIGAGGWEPVPVSAVSTLKTVTGVTDARARIWGVIRAGERTVTVVAMDRAAAVRFPELTGEAVPEAGHVVVGRGVGGGEAGSLLRLDGARSVSVTIADTVRRDLDLAAHDIVLMHPDDARKVLGLAPEMATDLVVYVYHDAEESAVLPDLAAVFPWPVRMTTRTAITGLYETAYTRRGGLVMMTSVPAVLALALLVFVSARRTLGRARDIGLMKALGWTPEDLIRLHLTRAAILGIAGVVPGLCLAYWMVFASGISWPGTLFLGWTASAPDLTLNPTGALRILPAVAALVLLPFIAAAGWAAMKKSLAPSSAFLEDGS